MPQDDSKYTDPELREEIKEDITEGDKGGQPGQWSARKAQMVAAEYKKQGGEYTEEKSEAQENLTKWGEEDWQTKEGSGTAKQDDGTEARYLPKAAWDKMTDEQKEETEKAKHDGSAAGEQHVPNTEAAKEARKEATEEQTEQKTEEKTDAPEVEKDEPMEEQSEVVEEEEEELEDEDEPEEEQSDYEGSDADDEPPKKSRKTDNGASSTKTRKVPSRAKPANPEKKTADKAEPNTNGEAGSVDRLPEKGQKVSWKSGASMAEGEVLEILKEESMLGKRKFNASEKDPRVKVKSATSGKEAIHKPSAVYW